MSQLHPVFPVVKLTSALEDPIPGHHTLPSPQPVLLDGEEHFEVESVLDSHILSVRVPIFPIVVCVRSAYVIGADVGFRVESGAVALLQLDL